MTFIPKMFGGICFHTHCPADVFQPLWRTVKVSIFCVDDPIFNIQRDKCTQQLTGFNIPIPHAAKVAHYSQGSMV